MDMKQGLDKYRFIQKPLDSENLCISNDYLTSIVGNLTTCFQHGLIPTYDIDQIPVNTDMSQLVNILQLDPLTPKEGVATIYDEMSLAMFDTVQSLIGQGYEFWQEHKRMLVIDYLLSTSICLVEQYGTIGTRVEKFYATRNPYLIIEFTGNEHKKKKYLEYIKYNEYNYLTGTLPLIKLRTSEGEIKDTVPRKPHDFNKVTKITPFYITRGILEHLDDILETGVYQVNYIKDNMTIRELLTTKSRAFLAKHYDSDVTSRMYLNQKSNLLRGYIHTPEVGISKYDMSGTRALNISRITNITKVDEKDIDMSYINVFFDNIMPSFKNGILHCSDVSKLNEVYRDFTGNDVPPQIAIAQNIQELLTSFIATQVAVGTTTALKRLHTYMLTRPEVFKGYTGGKPEVFKGNQGMMGVDMS